MGLWNSLFGGKQGRSPEGQVGTPHKRGDLALVGPALYLIPLTTIRENLPGFLKHSAYAGLKGIAGNLSDEHILVLYTFAQAAEKEQTGIDFAGFLIATVQNAAAGGFLVDERDGKYAVRSGSRAT